MGGKSENKAAYFDVSNLPLLTISAADLQIEIKDFARNLQIDLRRHSRQCKATSHINYLRDKIANNAIGLKSTDARNSSVSPR